MHLSISVSQELWGAVRRSYESQAWSNAILDALHFLSESIRSKSGLQSDGTALAGQAFGTKDPKIKLTRLITESDLNVQAGIEQLTRGMYQAIRNPRSHGRVDDSQHDADALIVFVDYILGVIGHAKSAFSIEGVLERLSDADFVPNKRYAELILNDVPKSKRLDVMIAAFEVRDVHDGDKLQQFFQAGISVLDEKDKALFFDAVSDHLRTSSTDLELKSVFQILKPEQWTSIREAERLRSENRIVRSAKGGKYQYQNRKCTGGGLATWARTFLKNFTLKHEFLSAIYSHLQSPVRERQDYALQFFFPWLDDLAAVPPPHFVHHIKARLRAGDQRYFDVLDSFEGWSDRTGSWIDPFKPELGSFKAKDDAAPDPEVDDDFPF